MEALYQVLTFVFGGTSVVGTVLSLVWWNQTKRLKEAEVKAKEAEAEKSQNDADDAEVARLHREIDHMQVIINNLTDLDKTHTQRMSELNAAIDKHIDRNRELSDRAYNSETEINRQNERIIKLTEERDDAAREADYYKMWRCERSDCQDPRGRQPPNDKLKGLKYMPPKRK